MTAIGNAAPNNVIDITSIRAASSTRDEGFARVLNEVSGRERTQNQPRNARNDEARRNSEATQNTAPRATDESRSTETDSRTQESSTGRNEAVSESTQNPVLSDEVKDELVEDVACALQITGEELLVVLVNLEMQLEDLAQTKNVTAVISEVLEAESPVELLGRAGVKEKYVEINEAVSLAYEKAASEAVQTQGPVSMAVNQAEGVIYTGNLEETVNLQVVSEEESFTFGTEKELSAERIAGASQHQAGNEANSGEGENNQNELFQNAEVEVNYAAQPATETQISTNTVTLNAETPQAAANREVADQIFEKIKVDIKPGVSEITMSLRPESLGEVSLRIASENGIITAHFVAESQRVKEIIESQLNQLKDSLEEQGVNVSELSVSVSTGNSEQHMNEFLKERSKSQGRIANILASLENGEPIEIDEKEVYNNNLNIKA